MSEPDDLASSLAVALGVETVEGLERMTGGASRETWAFTADGEELILRRDPPGRRNASHGMRMEADAMRACASAGLRVPEVLLHEDGALFGTSGLVMRRVPGETIARRILRDDEFSEARRVLVRELGEFLAGLHSIDPEEVPDAEERSDRYAIRAKYDRLDDHSETFEKTFDWLADHEPPPGEVSLVHGDVRLGNLLVSSSGLSAVIDWETVHVGDPLEDLAWLCLKAWRFRAEPEVAGLGTIDELVAAYEAAGGGPVDRGALNWWLVNQTLVWGVGCMLQASYHLSGGVRSVDLAGVGRRTAEQEWDLIELIAPDSCRAALAAPMPEQRADDRSYGRPTARELLDAVRGFLDDDIVPVVEGRLAYHARVSANILAIVERELAQQPAEHVGDDWDALALRVRDKLAVSSPQHLSDASRGLAL